MKIAVVLLWLGFLIFGVWWLTKHASPELGSASSSSAAPLVPCAPAQSKDRQDSYPAKHDIILNYRIGDTDLDWSAESCQKLDRTQFKGKYAARAIPAGDPVVLDDLRTAPVIQLSAGKSPYLLSLRSRPDLGRVLNAGSRIDLFQDSKPLLREVSVLAVKCDAIQARDCSAELDVSENDAKRLSEVGTQQLRIFVQQVQQREANMTALQWQRLDLLHKKVPAKPQGLWTMVYEHLEGPMKLKATGEWGYSSQKKYGPDGGLTGGLLQDAIVPSAPIGALIGKIGGSTADKPDPAKQLVFAVGNTCVIFLDEKTKGALFLTMNDQVNRFDEHIGEIDVEAWEAH